MSADEQLRLFPTGLTRRRLQTVGQPLTEGKKIQVNVAEA